MNRYYIDTNILIFLITANGDEELSSNVKDVVSDYGNMLLVSGVCVKEVIHLCQTGRLKRRLKTYKENRAQDVIGLIRDLGIRIMPVNEYHLREYSELRFIEDHSDPDDRLIISQAISDRIPLISSDRKFHYYEEDGLELVFNRR